MQKERLLESAQNAVNRAMSFIGMVALLVAGLVLTYSVFSRYLFRAATDWQDDGTGKVVPVGQKMFDVDDDEIPILEIRKLEFAAAQAAP